MKIKIDRYILRVLKDHLGYFVLIGFISLMLIYLIIFYQQKSSQNNFAIATIEQQNADYQQRIKLINQQTILLKENIDLDKINMIMTALIPEKEDFFSIINALNRLSSLTNFQVTSYAINTASSTDKSLSIIISGEGDREAFLKFLEHYNLGGGRLITIDKIDYSETNSYSIKIKLNFYTSKTNIQTVKKMINFTEQDKKLIKKIESQFPAEMLIQTENNESGDLNIDYKTKSQLF